MKEQLLYTQRLFIISTTTIYFNILILFISLLSFRETVRQLLCIMDPEGVQARRSRRLRRRAYISLGPNYVVHIDGYDKLKLFGFAIHGAIDGWVECTLSFHILTLSVLFQSLQFVINSSCSKKKAQLLRTFHPIYTIYPLPIPQNCFLKLEYCMSIFVRTYDPNHCMSKTSFLLIIPHSS